MILYPVERCSPNYSFVGRQLTGRSQNCTRKSVLATDLPVGYNEARNRTLERPEAKHLGILEK